MTDSLLSPRIVLWIVKICMKGSAVPLDPLLLRRYYLHKNAHFGTNILLQIQCLQCAQNVSVQKCDMGFLRCLGGESCCQPEPD